jgi:HSP20 family protein
MTALIPLPRLLGDLTGWFDTDFPVRTGHMIRVEDVLSDKEYVIRAELPGLEPGKDMQVTVEERFLTIFAQRREHEHTTGHSEFRYGTLQRAVRLPAGADTDHITARYLNGILEVTVPLREPEHHGRQVAITS